MIEWIWSKKGEKLYKSRKIIKEEPQSPISKKNPFIKGFINENKREKTYERMAQRKGITHRGINPFHQKDNYVKDISVQDTFLRPINSNLNLKNKDLNAN